MINTPLLSKNILLFILSETKYDMIFFNKIKELKDNNKLKNYFYFEYFNEFFKKNKNKKD